MLITNYWKNRTAMVLFIAIGLSSGCATFQSQKTAKNDIPMQGQKQISPELREKIATEAQKAIPIEPPLGNLPKVSYGKREGTRAGIKYVYEGDLLGDIYYGKGKLIYSNGFSYEGEFKEGKYDGKGSLAYPNGDHYAGEFRQGKRHGQGILSKADGKRQEGQFVDDKFSAK
ncbi:MAG: hypothetical protein BWK79_00885 [Beggiatoa sp. IS2]|nr:MAG: hypothetical protein BWK79_00885 [Beggiatoa sp. IS2]